MKPNSNVSKMAVLGGKNMLKNRSHSLAEFKSNGYHGGSDSWATFSIEYEVYEVSLIWAIFEDRITIYLNKSEISKTSNGMRQINTKIIRNGNNILFNDIC